MHFLLNLMLRGRLIYWRNFKHYILVHRWFSQWITLRRFIHSLSNHFRFFFYALIFLIISLLLRPFLPYFLHFFAYLFHVKGRWSLRGFTTHYCLLNERFLILVSHHFVLCILASLVWFVNSRRSTHYGLSFFRTFIFRRVFKLLSNSETALIAQHHGLTLLGEEICFLKSTFLMIVSSLRSFLSGVEFH